MTDRSTDTLDFVAVGLGPFNLGLACLTEHVSDLDGVFLEAHDRFDWHPGLLLPDATLQVPFLADLVTMADPTSPYSFLAFLKETGRLYSFYIRESFLPLRREYNQYCQWATERLASVRFGQAVTRVEHNGAAYVVHTAAGDTFRGRRLVLGTGTTPYVPDALRPLLNSVVEEGVQRLLVPEEVAQQPSRRTRDPGLDTVAAQPARPPSTTHPGLDTVAAQPARPPSTTAIHSADYLRHKAALQATDSITVVGSGQSAAEVYADLLADVDRCGYTLTWLTRSPRFFPMEYTKLTLEMTSPEYTAYFQGLPASTRERLLASQRGLYKGISSATIDTIFEMLRTRQVSLEPHQRRGDTTLLTATEVTGGRREGDEIILDLHHTEVDEHFSLRTSSLVLATGYRAQAPSFLGPVRDRIRWDEQGRYAASPTYTVDHDDREIFVQNGEEHTHGFVAPDLGMGAFRNSVIVNTMTGREVYPVEKRIAFQEFGVPDHLRSPA